MNALDILTFEQNAFYVLDRGYLDFSRLFKITLAKAFFVTRLKTNTQFSRVHSNSADPDNCIVSDQIIKLSQSTAQKNYPEKLRRVHFYDKEHNKHYSFLTNNFSLTALTIAKIFKARWQVELFFKWIKQHLHTKKFYGTSENAVRTQVWIAVSVYLLIAIIKKRLEIKVTAYTILQFLSVALFEKYQLNQSLMNNELQDDDDVLCNQLNLFE